MNDAEERTLAAELRALAEEIAREAGALLRDRAGDVRTEIGTKSTVTDMVTEVDRESELLISRRLLAARPGDGLTGEEGAARVSKTGVHWVCDPLDGTTNYLYGIPAYGVSIAAELEGRVLAAAVFDAKHGEMFSAARGMGATRDGVAIRVGRLGDLGMALVGTGFGYLPARRAHQGRITAYVLPRVRDIRRAGSAALDHCWVACGRLDAYYEQGVQQWDYAAGALIVEEAGGRTGGFVQGPLAGMRIAANATLYGPLEALIAEAEARAPQADAG